jgi:hypothetical protein
LAQLASAGYTTAYILGTNGWLYGPSSGVTAPDPINGIAGTPPAFSLIPTTYYTGSAYYQVPWTFSSGIDQGDAGLPIGGDPDPTGLFWSRFFVMFNPAPTSWTDIVNPPTATTDPDIGEVSLLQEIIAKFKPAKSSCVGIFVPGPAIKATIGFPWGTTTPNIDYNCWLSKAISTGDAPNSGAFPQTAPESVHSWLPNSTYASGGSGVIFTVPSSHYLNFNIARCLYSATALSPVTTGLVEPSWPVTIGNTVTDNGITWTCTAYLYNWDVDNTGSVCFEGVA